MPGPNRPDDQDPSGAESHASIVNTHWTTVYRFLHRMTGDTHDAEDLTQETFLKALGRLDSLRPGSCLRVWLLKIAANSYLDVHRKRRRIEFQALDREPVAPLPPPDHRLDVGEQAALLIRALQALPETTRMVFHLRAAEDLPFRDIADLVGTTEEAARWHMRQARVKLLAQLAEKPSK